MSATGFASFELSDDDECIAASDDKSDDSSDGIDAERDENNGAIFGNAPPVFPYQLVAMELADYNDAVLSKHRERLYKYFTDDEIESIEEQFKELGKRYRKDVAFKATIDSHTVNTMFDQAWESVGEGFDMIRTFSGGLATVFANTSSVESDFSNLKWEQDSYRSCLMPISLAGIMHSKQHDLLKSLAKHSTGK